MSTCLRCTHFLEAGANPTSSPPLLYRRIDNVGLCRRSPPIWIVDPEDEDGGAFCFPTIHEQHSCGDFKPRISI